MSAPVAARVVSIALIGNPNTGKSTLFNALSGSRQRVGNFPGCTVEKKVGSLVVDGQKLQLVDLPGTYSLQPRSPDEMVAVDVLLGRRPDTPRPDAVVCIVDASNLERNLYLVSQVLEVGLPVVLALNMTDLAAEKGYAVDAAQLRQRLGRPVVELQAHRGRGLAELKAAITEAMASTVPPPESPFPQAFRDEVSQLEAKLNGAGGDSAESLAGDPAEAMAASTSTFKPVPRYLVERLLLDTSGYLEGVVGRAADFDLHAAVQEARSRLKSAGCPIPGIEAMARYAWVEDLLDGILTRPSEQKVTLGDRLDAVLTHKWAGTLIFAGLMLLVFMSIFAWATPAMDLIDGGKEYVAGLVSGVMPEGALRSLVVDGVIEGVGGVLIFLPQIMILFFFIGILEDCGYMARVAYLMDRLMSRVGLSGKSFIPLLSSFACAIPGIMATRVIENPRDRLTTILVAPLMSCSARLPVYLLLTAAFIPNIYFAGFLSLQALTIFGMYVVGVLAAVVVAFLLKVTFLKGETPPFVMELPSYKWPSPTTVLWRVLERGWAFIRRAGTLILAVTVVVWALLYFPQSDVPDTAEGAQQQLEQSLLGQAGQVIEPVFQPLGWDWRISTAALASFPAREVVVSVMGTIYSLGDVDAGDEEQRRTLGETLASVTWPEDSPYAGQKVFNVPVALSIMVFFALCAQCGATLAVIKRETNSWWWPVFTFAYMTGLAYVAALVTYQLGMFITGLVA